MSKTTKLAIQKNKKPIYHNSKTSRRTKAKPKSKIVHRDKPHTHTQTHTHRRQHTTHTPPATNYSEDTVDDFDVEIMDSDDRIDNESMEDYSEEINAKSINTKKATNKKLTKKVAKKAIDEVNDNDDDDDDEEIRPKQMKLAEKTREHLKRKITEWLDCDDKIKLMNAKVKQYKDEKKRQEEFIIKVITKLGMEESKINIHDENKQLRSRVYRHKSVTKGAIKENIIKDALMESIRDEKRVEYLIKKIEQKRPVNERYYLKRTKGTNNE